MEIPIYYYIFINSSLPVTHANLSITKTFASSAYTEAKMDASFKEKYLAGAVDYLPFIPNQGRDLRSFSPFCLNVMNDYRVEYDAELVRRRFFPLAPSRLSAVYAFADYETCQRVSEKYGWSLGSVHRFALIWNELVRVLRVNMEIVSLARKAYSISSLSDDTVKTIWKHYWSGSADIDMELPTADFKREVFSSGVIWEYLIEGQLVRID